MEDLTYDSFCEFVREQPAYKAIDHVTRDDGTSAWAYCAIGEWYTAQTGAVLPLNVGSAVADIICSANPVLYYRLNVSEPSTYGELLELVEDLL